MAKGLRIAAFEGGALRFLASDTSGRETVLGLPLNRLLVKMVRVPAGEDPVAVATPLLKAASPFPDEELTVSCEVVREDERGRVVLAAALPEGSADDIGEALDAAKLSVVRIDSLAIGQLRGVWGALGEMAGRRLVLMRSVDCLSILVLDGDQPSAIRAITDLEDLRREVTLSLLEAEDFGGRRKLEEILVVLPEGVASDVSEEVLSAFAPVRTVTVGADAALVGVAARTTEEGALDALPASWREVLEETRFKAKLTRNLLVAGGLWLLAIGVLFGVPAGYGFLTDRQRDLSKRHARQHAAVMEMKAKVELIRKYSDRARSALEIMKAISDRLPEGVRLTSWSYRRDEGVSVAGEAETAEATYALKDAMDELAATDGEGEERRIFPSVALSGPSATKNGYKFALDCRYRAEEEE